MSYIKNTLMKNEIVLYQTKPHWIVFAWPIVLLCTTIFLFIFGPNIHTLDYRILPNFPFFSVIAFVALGLSMLMGISSFISYQTSEYAVTNKRVLMKIGFIRRVVVEIFIQKIESVKVYQTVDERLFGYGSITLSGVGGSKDPFHTIPDPLEFRRRVQEQIEESGRINK